MSSLILVIPRTQLMGLQKFILVNVFGSRPGRAQGLCSRLGRVLS